jgi:hypothetical protein
MYIKPSNLIMKLSPSPIHFSPPFAICTDNFF